MNNGGRELADSNLREMGQWCVSENETETTAPIHP